MARKTAAKNTGGGKGASTNKNTSKNTSKSKSTGKKTATRKLLTLKSALTIDATDTAVRRVGSVINDPKARLEEWEAHVAQQERKRRRKFVNDW